MLLHSTKYLFENKPYTEADFDDDYSVFKFGRIPSSDNNQQKYQEYKVCFLRFDSLDNSGYSSRLVV